MVEQSLFVIASVLIMMLICKDTSGKTEIRELRKEVERVADALERRAADG